MTTAPGRIPRAQPFGIRAEQRSLTPTAGMGRPRGPNGLGEGIRGAGHFFHGDFVHGVTFRPKSELTFRRGSSYTPAAAAWQKEMNPARVPRIVARLRCSKARSRLPLEMNAQPSTEPHDVAVARETEVPRVGVRPERARDAQARAGSRVEGISGV